MYEDMAIPIDPEKLESDTAYINRKITEGMEFEKTIKKWCPECEPERDPIKEVLIEKWCWRHAPPEILPGTADDRVSPTVRSVPTWHEATLGF